MDLSIKDKISQWQQGYFYGDLILFCYGHLYIDILLYLQIGR